jgi:integration host factor subunit beta
VSTLLRRATGEKVKIKPKKLPFFKVGKELRERVNG